MKYTAIILCIYNQKRNKNINLVMGHKDNTITAGAFALNKEIWFLEEICGTDSNSFPQTIHCCCLSCSRWHFDFFHLKTSQKHFKISCRKSDFPWGQMQTEVWHLHRFISQWKSVDAPLDTLKTWLIPSQVYSNNDPPPCSAADNITRASFLSGYKHQKVAQILLENDLSVKPNTIDHSEVWIYYSGFLSSNFNNANTGAGLQYSEGNTHQWFDPQLDLLLIYSVCVCI